MAALGIMQGRLVAPEGGRFQSFPREHWRDEFPLSVKAGLHIMEWIYDVFGEDANPLGTDAGIQEMKELGERYGLRVRSVCADYFMDRPFVRVGMDQRISAVNRLLWLLSRCSLAGITRIVLPFVDQSRIETNDDQAAVVDVLNLVLTEAERRRIELHLETSLSPVEFASLLGRLTHPLVKVNYDSGNSASLGYRPREEFASYGSRIGSVHIKDRILGGGTVPLGTGDVDFVAVFDGLRDIGYSGDFVLQVARGEEQDEVEWAKSNGEFVTKRSLHRSLPAFHKGER